MRTPRGSSPSLSNKDLYPMFGRTHPPDTAVTQALPLMLKHLGYGTIGVLHTNDDCERKLVSTQRSCATPPPALDRQRACVSMCHCRSLMLTARLAWRRCQRLL